MATLNNKIKQKIIRNYPFTFGLLRYSTNLGHQILLNSLRIRQYSAATKERFRLVGVHESDGQEGRNVRLLNGRVDSDIE